LQDTGIRISPEHQDKVFERFYRVDKSHSKQSGGTGFSAAAAIAKRILDGEANAVEDYKRFLSSGGSADPISLLKIAGVDMSSPEPISAALELFNELLDEMEELI